MRGNEKLSVNHRTLIVLALIVSVIGIGIFSFNVIEGDLDGDGIVTPNDALLHFCSERSHRSCPKDSLTTLESFRPEALHQELGEFPIQFFQPQSQRAFRESVVPKGFLQGDEVILSNGYDVHINDETGSLMSRRRRGRKNGEGVLIVDRGNFLLPDGSPIVSESFSTDLGRKRIQTIVVQGPRGIERPVLFAQAQLANEKGKAPTVLVRRKPNDGTLAFTVRRRCKGKCQKEVVRVNWLALPRTASISTEMGSIRTVSKGKRKRNRKKRNVAFLKAKLPKSRFLQVQTRKPFLLAPAQRFFIESNPSNPLSAASGPAPSPSPSPTPSCNWSCNDVAGGVDRYCPEEDLTKEFRNSCENSGKLRYYYCDGDKAESDTVKCCCKDAACHTPEDGYIEWETDLCEHKNGGYVTMFESHDQESLTFSVKAKIIDNSLDTPPHCKFVLRANGAPLEEEVKKECSGSSCELSVKVERSEERSVAGTISVSAALEDCCTVQVGSSIDVHVLEAPYLLVNLFSGIGGDSGQFTHITNAYVGEPVSFSSHSSGSKEAYKSIASYAKYNLLQSEEDRAACKRYRTVNMVGFSNGGHAALYNAYKLSSEENVEVDNLITIDPVPWDNGDRPQPHPWRKECHFRIGACVKSAENHYQNDHSSDPCWFFGSCWGQRGRKVNGAGSNSLYLGYAPHASAPAGCGNGYTWPDEAHNMMLCQSSVVDSIKGMIDGADLIRDSYECSGGVNPITCP